MPSAVAQATPARPAAVAPALADVAEVVSVTGADQLAPLFVDTRALTARLLSAVQLTLTSDPVTDTTGTPKRPEGLIAVVVPSAVVFHVAPRSRLMAILTEPVALSVYAT
jgi:hypothetical protein